MPGLGPTLLRMALQVCKQIWHRGVSDNVITTVLLPFSSFAPGLSVADENETSIVVAPANPTTVGLAGKRQRVEAIHRLPTAPVAAPALVAKSSLQADTAISSASPVQQANTTGAVAIVPISASTNIVPSLPATAADNTVIVLDGMENIFTIPSTTGSVDIIEEMSHDGRSVASVASDTSSRQEGRRKTLFKPLADFAKSKLQRAKKAKDNRQSRRQALVQQMRSKGGAETSADVQNNGKTEEGIRLVANELVLEVLAKYWEY